MQKKIQAVSIANQILAGRISIIAGCRILKKLSLDLVPDWRVDSDFVVIGAFESETDHLPLDDELNLWDPKVFSEKQIARAQLEESEEVEIRKACESIISRFSSSSN